MFTAYHAKHAAHHLLRGGQGDAVLAKSLLTAKVDMKPHQVDAALFALHSPLARGAILADEVGLGKTIEAGLVIAQRWAERRRHILLVVPASLRKQWVQELREKFGIDSEILEAKSYDEATKADRRPFDRDDKVVLTSYEFAARRADDLRAVQWDLVVFDEAHRLRNVYKKGGAVRAKAFRQALADCFKLLLTATPLQNSLLELYGLVSMIDGDFFGSEEAFKLLYGRRPGHAALDSLRQRLEPIYIRHLRRDVQTAGHVAFTDRKVLTLDFEPADREVQVYEAISRYLQRFSTVAFGEPPNPLILTVARKVLGSSTVAIVRFLENVLRRLQARQAFDLAEFPDFEGAIETGGEDAETVGADPAPFHDPRSTAPGLADSDLALADACQTVDAQVLAAEIAEVEGYLALARSIGSNAKGEKLVSSLSDLLDRVADNGGRRKVVVFTEFVRTQNYLADILANAGWKGRIVRLNGSNGDPDSTRIYNAWVARHAGTDAISGSRSADMKAAIVEAFRSDDVDILIATESGAEGINLQFCSLLVNFDLPWNPQRVEQRIGRCHRYGQRLDVTVINFMNRRNRAEARVYELLRDKFHLFEGVFGASDGVLGVIASGVDFERAVVDIVQRCRTDTEISEAFARLEADLDESIAADMADARRKVFDSLDQSIVQRLQARGDVLDRVLDDSERRLLAVARVELPDARFEDDSVGRRFVLGGQTWTTAWSLAEERGWHFFRLGDGTLAMEVVGRARHRELPVSHVIFDPGALRTAGLPGFAAVDQLKGKAGWMRVSCLSLASSAEAGRPRTVSVVAAAVDDGTVVDPDTVEQLLLVPGSDRGPPETAPPHQLLAELERAHEAVRVREAQGQNARWLDEEDARLRAQAEDLTRAAEERAKALDAQITTARKALRAAVGITPEEDVKERRRISNMQRQRDTIRFETMTRRGALQDQIHDNLDMMAMNLAVTANLEPLFTLRWEVA